MALPGLAAEGFDHGLLSSLLARTVQAGQVDYDLIRQRYRPQLEQYVASLAHGQPDRYGRDGAVAFWLNAYNALVIKAIVDGAAPNSAFTRGSFFRRTRFLVAGEKRSLDDIEHRALRPLAKDPRVHFVLVCGAKSCPPLRAEAFLTGDLEKLLEDSTHRFLNDPRHVVVDLAHRRLRLSKLFDWYSDDFGDIPAFLARYRPAAEQAQLRQGKWSLDFFDYDWATNQAP
jgi:hypothetical protein